MLGSRARRLAVLAVSTAILASARFARADSNIPPLIGENALNPFLAHGMPTNPMHAGLLETKLSAGEYVQKKTGQGDSMSIQGFGGSASAIYAFNDHFGVSGMFARIQSMRGSAAVNLKLPNSVLFATSKTNCNDCDGGDVSGQATEGGIQFIMDPFHGDGFRLPVFVGASYLSVDGKVDDTGKGLKREGSIKSPAWTAGISPQFNAWRFRIAPFGLLTYTTKRASASVVDYNPTTGKVNKQSDFTLTSDDYRQTVALGANFTYRPWGLAFGYVFADEGQASYILTWSHRWGGSAK